MALFHRSKARKIEHDAHLNFMGGASWDLADPVLRLRIAAASSFFGEPQYYHRDPKDGRPKRVTHRVALTDAQVVELRDLLDAADPQDWRGLSPSARMESAIDAALDHDAERTLLEAVRLREEEHIRTTPQVILVRAAHHASVRGTGLVRRYAKQIVARADEPAVGLAYQLHAYGKPIPNALKKAWRDALSRQKAYQLAKYRMHSRAVKTLDVMNLVHPKGEVFDHLAKGTLKSTDTTWEAILSAKGSSKATWLEALEVMGHMALLRNLRNLLQAGIEPAHFVDRLRAGAKHGKQLPFRYYSAYRAVQKDAPGPVLDAIEDCLVQSLACIPYFRGRVMSLCDNSGSARCTTTSSMGSMEIATIANLTAVLTGMASEDGHVGVFGDRLDTFAVRKRSSIFDQLNLAEEKGRGIGMGTETGVWTFWDRAIRKQEHWDHVFVYSDMQAGHGGLYGSDRNAYAQFAWNGAYIHVPKLIAEYRKRVNPKVHVHLVQIAGYQDTIVPEVYDRTTILGGWGDGLLRFAAGMANLRDPGSVHLPKQ